MCLGGRKVENVCVGTYERMYRFTLRTDHQALTTLLSTKGMDRADMRVARWSRRLLCFQYDVQYRPAKQNWVADCLSHMPLSPFQHVAIDIVGTFEKGVTDCKFEITLIDYFSKWPEVGFASSVTTETVLKFLTTIFAWEGNPCTITTDTAVHFIWICWFCETQGIKHKCSQANGAIERFNRVLKECLQAAEVAHKPWKSAVLTMLKSYRATPHATMGETPFLLLRGRPMRTKLNVLLPEDSPDQFIQVRACVKQRQNKSKQYTNRKRRYKFLKIAVGDKVREWESIFAWKKEKPGSLNHCQYNNKQDLVLL